MYQKLTLFIFILVTFFYSCQQKDLPSRKEPKPRRYTAQNYVQKQFIPKLNQQISFGVSLKVPQNAKFSIQDKLLHISSEKIHLMLKCLSQEEIELNGFKQGEQTIIKENSQGYFYTFKVDQKSYTFSCLGNLSKSQCQTIINSLQIISLQD